MKLPESVKKLIDEPNIAFFATLMKDGSPQVTPVWVDRENDFILVNTAEGRIKANNVKRDPRVAISIADRNNPYSMSTIRGKVVDITEEGADSHIDKMAKKYTGQDRYAWKKQTEKRIIIKIEASKVYPKR